MPKSKDSKTLAGKPVKKTQKKNADWSEKQLSAPPEVVPADLQDAELFAVAESKPGKKSKSKKKRQQPPSFPKNIADSLFARKVKESASQIWLAGLGAYAVAEKEGSKLFETLVSDGKKLDQLTKNLTARNVVEQKVALYKERVEEVKDLASHSWDRIEKSFDERVSGALSRLNIPTKKDVELLQAQVAELSDKLESLLSQAKQPSSE